MQAWNDGASMLTSSGYVAQVDEDLCAGCGICADYCQLEAIAVDNGYAVAADQPGRMTRIHMEESIP